MRLLLPSSMTTNSTTTEMNTPKVLYTASEISSGNAAAIHGPMNGMNRSAKHSTPQSTKLGNDVPICASSVDEVTSSDDLNHRAPYTPELVLAEALSKSSKQKFRFQKNFNYWETEKFVESRYTPEVVAKLTGLTGDSLAAFMMVYPMPYEYARVVSDLELKMWVRNNYKEWIKSPQLPEYLRQESLRDSAARTLGH